MAQLLKCVLQYSKFIVDWCYCASGCGDLQNIISCTCVIYTEDPAWL